MRKWALAWEGVGEREFPVEEGSPELVEGRWKTLGFQGAYGSTDMKFIVAALLAIFLGYIVYQGVFFYGKLRVSKELAARATPYTKDEAPREKRVLVLGDSTAVGVGAEPKASLASLLAEHIGAGIVENYAVSGARARDLMAQAERRKHDAYDVILIQAGANDIIQGGNLDSAITDIANVVESLQPYAKQVLVLTAGDVGAATFFPKPLRVWYHARTLTWHDRTEQAIYEAGGTYVNLYKPSRIDPFVKEPAVYLAADGLHPTAKGYALWFKEVIEVLKTNINPAQ